MVRRFRLRSARVVRQWSFRLQTRLTFIKLMLRGNYS
jgi:hypothetical protein